MQPQVIKFERTINDKTFVINFGMIKRLKRWSLEKMIGRVNWSETIWQNFFRARAALSRNTYCMVGEGDITSIHLNKIELIKKVEARDQGFGAYTIDSKQTTAFHEHKSNGWIILFKYHKKKNTYIPWRMYEDTT
ncbi:MAG: hypothetical protein NTX91_00165 [candidate division SR1 bacterium]|nr:hypothetical protein [candidate division SR1 bacterium]